MFAAELTEELEDSEGNVYNRKVRLSFSVLRRGKPFGLTSFPRAQTWDDRERLLATLCQMPIAKLCLASSSLLHLFRSASATLPAFFLMISQ